MRLTTIKKDNSKRDHMIISTENLLEQLSLYNVKYILPYTRLIAEQANGSDTKNLDKTFQDTLDAESKGNLEAKIPLFYQNATDDTKSIIITFLTKSERLFHYLRQANINKIFLIRLIGSNSKKILEALLEDVEMKKKALEKIRTDIEPNIQQKLQISSPFSCLLNEMMTDCETLSILIPEKINQITSTKNKQINTPENMLADVHRAFIALQEFQKPLFNRIFDKWCHSIFDKSTPAIHESTSTAKILGKP